MGSTRENRGGNNVARTVGMNGKVDASNGMFGRSFGAQEKAEMYLISTTHIKILRGIHISAASDPNEEKSVVVASHPFQVLEK